MENPLWTPPPERVEGANVTRFARWVAAREGLDFSDYQSLHKWSIEASDRFWSAVWDFCEIIGDKGSKRIVEHLEQMPGANWFPDA